MNTDILEKLSLLEIALASGDGHYSTTVQRSLDDLRAAIRLLDWMPIQHTSNLSLPQSGTPEYLAAKESAWERVCEVLTELSPGWHMQSGTGIDCAEKAIRDLAAKSTHDNNANVIVSAPADPQNVEGRFKHEWVDELASQYGARQHADLRGDQVASKAANFWMSQIAEKHWHEIIQALQSAPSAPDAGSKD